VLEGTRLSTLRYEAFQRHPGDEAGVLKSMLCHGRIGTTDLPGGTWNAGDRITCRVTMWISFLTRDFERQADGHCLIAIKDAASGETSQVRIVVRREPPNEHLLHSVDQLAALFLNRQLERLEGKRRIARFAKTLLTRTVIAALLLTKRIPRLAQKGRSALAPISPS
jgi:hypothetical protein